MAFGAFSLELASFLSLLTILASLPTDPSYYPWHDGPPSYGVTYDAYRPPDPRFESRAFGRRNFSGGPGEPGPPPYGAPPPEDRWYRLQRRGGSPQGGRQDFPPHRQRGLGGGAPSPSGEVPASRRRHSDSVIGEEYQGVQNIGNSYSSHVNYDEANQNNEAAKTPRNFGENIEPIFGSSVSGNIDERINFEEGSRSVRTGNSKEVDIPNPRIVTPKGGRRPLQGAATPFPTTEKTFRNQTTKGSKKPRPNNSKPQGGDIVFPDGYPKKFIPRITKCAKKSTFCEHVGEEYPTEYINQVLKKEGAMFREFFGRDVISGPNITERFNIPEENSLCPYRQEVVFPRAAQNKEDKWLFVINQDQYVQGVTVEVCLNPETRCAWTEGFPLGYTPYCKQKYIERRLVAIGEDGKPHSDSFRLPSCCSCVVKHETSARMSQLRSYMETSAPP